MRTNTETHVAAGDRHGQPDISPHMRLHPRHLENGGANGISPLSPVNEKLENGAVNK